MEMTQTQSRQHGLAVLCTFCFLFCAESDGNIEDIYQQEVSFYQNQDNHVSETNETDVEFIPEIGTIEILDAKLRVLTKPSDLIFFKWAKCYYW